MGNRATCPVCGSYSSDVLLDINNGKNCRVCECPHEILEDYQIVVEQKELYRKNKISNELVEENDILIKENAILRTKISKIISILGYSFDSPLLESIKKTIQILHDEVG